MSEFSTDFQADLLRLMRRRRDVRRFRTEPVDEAILRDCLATFALAPSDWRLVAYLCIGWPEAESDTPELELAGWEHRRQDVLVETR